MSYDREYGKIMRQVADLQRQLAGPPRPVPALPVAPVAYRHPDGHTWDGKGRPPKWIRESEASGLPRVVWRVAP